MECGGMTSLWFFGSCPLPELAYANPNIQSVVRPPHSINPKSSRSQTPFGNALPRNSVSASAERGASWLGCDETEFREIAFPNRVWEREYASKMPFSRRDVKRSCAKVVCS